MCHLSAIHPHHSSVFQTENEIQCHVSCTQPPLALEPSQTQLASTPAWPSVNTLSCVQPRNCCQYQWPQHSLMKNAQPRNKIYDQKTNCVCVCDLPMHVHLSVLTGTWKWCTFDLSLNAMYSDKGWPQVKGILQKGMHIPFFTPSEKVHKKLQNFMTKQCTVRKNLISSNS